jgi:hypothetical protein
MNSRISEHTFVYNTGSGNFKKKGRGPPKTALSRFGRRGFWS